MSKKIQLDAPNVGVLEKKYLNRAIDSNYVSSVGPFITEFENKFSAYLGVKRAVAIQSGTAALYMSLYELGIGKGDEVIVPALTFVATVNPIIYAGAKPVFVDVDLATWNIDTKKIAQVITNKTKAIIPVHLYGNPCNMVEIMAIAKKYDLKVIEDATESLGARYKSQHTGTFGDFGCFSFNGNKIITTGGGGAIVGRNTKRLQHIKFLINQAKDESKSRGCYHSEMGFNYRMTNIEAALGLAQMEKLNKFLDKKRLYNSIYRKKLRNITSIHFQEEYENAHSAYWLSCIIFNRKINIPTLQSTLKAKGIPTRRIFIPLVEFPPYKKYKRTECRNSYSIYERGLCLPSSTLNSEDDIQYVCMTIRALTE
ncbi:MAG: hypothetical protein UX17_C0002G0011 [Parcubacteria group bacterium GW2011_GWC2_45_7]|nr:MAG: hypothetical protein UX17_C0002G0011 [Parcubacteria group bacterium GW2011_GWC2_45_7]KKU74140.1 MAG: hypothetical protein UX98_C0001G0070 [Parcubacteria group bacterium GW2011_GWA2_47_26]